MKSVSSKTPPSLESRRNFLIISGTLLASPVPAKAQPAFYQSRIGPVPNWIVRDLQRKAAWLPPSVNRWGLEEAYSRRLQTFSPDIQSSLTNMNIPPWMIALIPPDTGPADQQYEIQKQLRFMSSLAGPPPTNKYAQRIEQLLIFSGAGQLPTPGDRLTGRSLGDEGCSSAISHYVLAPLRLERPELSILDNRLTDSQSSSELNRLFTNDQKTGFVRVKSIPFESLHREDFSPGSLLIAQKPGGTHVMGWTRVPSGWGWDPRDLMAIGNTGLFPYGNRMILAQEYITPPNNGETKHNDHGPINSHAHGFGLSDPATNVYAAKGSRFIMIDFVDSTIPSLSLSPERTTSTSPMMDSSQQRRAFMKGHWHRSMRSLTPATP